MVTYEISTKVNITMDATDEDDAFEKFERIADKLHDIVTEESEGTTKIFVSMVEEVSL